MEMGRRRLTAAPPFAGEAQAVGLTPIACIQGAKAADYPAPHRRARSLVGGVPLPAVAHGGQVKTIQPIALTETQYPIVAPVIVRVVPGTIAVQDLEGAEHVPGSEC